MNLFKAFSKQPEPPPASASAPDPSPDPPLNTAALLKPAGAPPAPVTLTDGKPVFTEPATPLLVAVRDEIAKSLKTCFDPEIPVNIYDLGLIYDIVVTPQEDSPDTASVVVRMTLTSPACPAAGSLPPEVQFKAGQIAGVTSSKVELVWDPQWNPNMMTDAAKLQLGMF